jgi:hypothetical protein
MNVGIISNAAGGRLIFSGRLRFIEIKVGGFAPIGMVECWNIGHAVKL